MIALMHGTDYAGQDLAGWWISEKLDGWRAVWTGSELLTRQGGRYAAPSWFTAGLPDCALDCELVRTDLQTTAPKVQSAVQAGQWSRLGLRAFDLVASGTLEAATARLATLAMPPHVSAVAWRAVKSTSAALAIAAEVQSEGGEGVMVRKPASVYSAGRTGNLLKIK